MMSTAAHAGIKSEDGEKEIVRMRAILASPRGFCAGVDRAIKIVELALQKYGAPVYVRHEIVHNKYVVESLKRQGAVFVDEIDPSWLIGVKTVGISAGASAPEVLVQEVVARLKELGISNVKQETVVEENLVFTLPKELGAKKESSICV